MKLLDANLLLYAVNADAPVHSAARRWLEQVLSGTEPVGFAWVALLAFVRLATRPAIFPSPLAPEQAFEILEAWLAQPCATVLHPTERHAALLRRFARELGTAGNLTTDAHLAALAVEHGATLCSTDADFRRFPGLRWVNPLAK